MCSKLEGAIGDHHLLASLAKPELTDVRAYPRTAPVGRSPVPPGSSMGARGEGGW